jgi:transporter family protein
VCWSASTLLLRPVLAQIDVPTASAIRMPLASALLWIAAFRGGVLPTREQLRGHALIAVIATGVTTTIAMVCFLESVALAGAGRAAVLTATSPLFAVPFAVVFLGEPGSWRIAAGALCSVVGVVLLAQR